VELAPDFALPDHEGNLWRLADQRGHPVVLIFHRHLA
jgi:peroxiredoxin